MGANRTYEGWFEEAGRSVGVGIGLEAHTALGVVACLAILAGCATSSVGQAQEIAPGIYSISFAAKAETEAISKAGEYCHAKGQKLSILHEGDYHEVRFRCVASD